MKIFDPKTKRTRVVFNEYELKGSAICPECGRPLDEHDLDLLNLIGVRSCVKCGAKLRK